MDRVVVVDDRPDTLAGRVLWLSRVPGAAVEGLSFVEALDPATDWSDVFLAVLDGRDDRVADECVIVGDDGRERASHDRFLGVRVAQRIRATRGPDQTRIVLISAYARANDVLARRCQEAGVDYLYSVHELLDAEAFLATILSPRPANATQRLLPPGHWQGQGLTGVPDFTAAIDAAERNPAGAQVIFDLPGKRHPGTAHHLRRLRELVGPTLKIRVKPPHGPRDRHVSKREISAWLRRALGYGADSEPR